MMGEAQFRAMKPSATFINVGRGPTVDEAALYEALSEKRIAGAAIDVYEQEPYPDGAPLYALDNVILSPTSPASCPAWTCSAPSSSRRTCSVSSPAGSSSTSSTAKRVIRRAGRSRAAGAARESARHVPQ